MNIKIKIKNIAGTVVLTLILLAITAITALADAPTNDNFADARVIPGTPYTDIIDTTDATTEQGEPMGCYWIFQKSIWYSYTPAQNGFYSLESNGGSHPVLAIYTGSDLNNLQVVDCQTSMYSAKSTLYLNAGTTYYIQTFFAFDDMGLNINFNIYQVTPPTNDNFIDAKVISQPSYSDSVYVIAATSEPGEPAGCGQEAQRSIWYSFRPTTNGSYTVDAGYFTVVAIYTGSDLSSLNNIACAVGDWNAPTRLTVRLEANTTYYYQVYIYYYWDSPYIIGFNLYPTPPAEAYFNYWPGDANKYDSIQFNNYSYDPVGAFVGCNWNFGDGTSSTDWSPIHTYVSDGDYTVNLEATTSDGRSASTSQIVQVRTHDVGVTRFEVSNSARVGQTKQINVYIKNLYYQETVQVDLYKITANGNVWVGSLVQSMPVRPANRAQLFTFAYTFSKEDAAVGKVTFKVIANIINARDAFPLDNELISYAIKVTK
ncbi:MAG: hypothetical protein C3F13_14735 [Anaerolineales bacterium]|nr:MAG: hypothetical protein C3F13_14735 [Anaerolineales bacterium]